MTHPVNWFSISGTDGQALMSFYKKVFGWKMDPMPDAEASGMVKPEQGGIPGDVSRSMSGQAQVTVYIGVKDIDEHMKKIQKAGGEPAMPKMQLPPGFGWISQFRDPAGNTIGLWQAGAAMSAPAAEAPAAEPAPAKRAKKAKPAKTEEPAKEEPVKAKKAAKAAKAAEKPAKPAKPAKAAKAEKPAKPAKAAKAVKPAKAAKAAKAAKPAPKPAKAAKAPAAKPAKAAKAAKPAKGAAKAKPKAKGKKA